MFRKPKKSIRARQIVLSDDEDNKEVSNVKDIVEIDSSFKENGNLDDIRNLKEIQSNISRFKEGKLEKKKKKAIQSHDKTDSSATKTFSIANTLSFDQELEGG